MKRYPKPLTWLLCAGTILSIVVLWPMQTYTRNASAKKLIYYGWGLPDTQYARHHWRQMEAMPFDGVGIVVAIDRQAWQRGERSTGNDLGWQVMGLRAFTIEDFREAIADLKAPKWRTLTDNFLPITFSSTVSAAGLNWFDDKRWHIIVNNFGVLAGIAAVGGIKGLILDPEHYNYALFRYADQRQQIDRPFEDYVKIARQRGRDVMAAIAAHLPHAVLLSLFGYTLPLDELNKPGQTRQQAAYGLLPAFFDGLLEAMPAGASLVDGYEHAYPFKKRRQFLSGYQQIRQEAMKLSAVPALYHEKLRAGFGLWLDYKKQPNYFTPEEFRQAVGAALEVSDEYVWIYSEEFRFFPPAGVKASYIEAMAAARGAMKAMKQ